jgi:hypothetical protein
MFQFLAAPFGLFTSPPAFTIEKFSDVIRGKP